MSDDRSESTTRRLASEAQKGAPRFDELYQRVASALFLWGSLRIPQALRRFVEPEDLMQEVWCRALRRFDSWDPEKGKFRAWLMGIAHRVLLEMLRRVNRGSRMPTAGPEVRVFDPEEVPEEVTTACRRLARSEGVRALLDEVNYLPAEDRVLLLGRGLEDRPHADIAKDLGIDTLTVKKRWQRLRERLVKELAAFEEVLV